jgi:hypothetical protein
VTRKGLSTSDQARAPLLLDPQKSRHLRRIDRCHLAAQSKVEWQRTEQVYAPTCDRSAGTMVGKDAGAVT